MKKNKQNPYFKWNEQKEKIKNFIFLIKRTDELGSRTDVCSELSQPGLLSL